VDIWVRKLISLKEIVQVELMCHSRQLERDIKKFDEALVKNDLNKLVCYQRQMKSQHKELADLIDILIDVDNMLNDRETYLFKRSVK
jgi:hypothetical protein